MFKEDAWYASEWHHIVGAANPVFDGAYAPLNFWDMFIGTAAVNIDIWECWPQWFKLRVSKYGLDLENSLRID